MADPAAEARIRDLKRRLELDPGSRLFVALAEEYRKSKRLPEALSALQKGLLAHPNYLSAQVALGRAYLEAGHITEAIATFSKTLAADPGNLVSARLLADIYLSRGDSVESIKKYKLYRALSGDRRVDEIIERLAVELAPPPPAEATARVSEVPPPPTFFDSSVTRAARTSPEESVAPSGAALGSAADLLDDTSVPFEPDESFGRRPAAVSGFVPVLSRDVPLVSVARAHQPSRSKPETTARSFGVAGAVAPGPELPGAGMAPPDSSERALADLYVAQGRYAEALDLYDEQVAAHPLDLELKRLRSDAEARLLPAAPGLASAAAGVTLDRRLARIRVLKQWLSVVQAG